MLVIALIVGALSWYVSSYLIVAIAVFLATYLGGGYGLQRVGFNIFGMTKSVIQRRRSSYYTCICCHQPVKEIVSNR
jgi:hypothetical protein